MGLRDRYLSALVARCVVAVPSECNTQPPAEVLHVAPPRQTQHATADPAPAPMHPLRATNDATTAQQAQHDDHEARVERSAIVSADGVPYLLHDDTLTGATRPNRRAGRSPARCRRHAGPADQPR